MREREGVPHEKCCLILSINRLFSKPCQELRVSGVERLASLRLFWMPVQQPALRAIGKPLLDGKIRNKHGPHHVRARHVARGLEIWMEISRDVQSPQALRPRVTTRVQGSVLCPPSRSGAATSDSRFDFQCMVPGFRYPSHEDAVPAVTVSPASREQV